jgi:tRNA 2-thiouridine synthesizing protein A
MNELTISADQVLDCSGLSCPIPIIKTSKAIKLLEIGQVLKVISTDSGSPPDMDAWSRQTGHELLDSHQDENQYIFYFRRSK